MIQSRQSIKEYSELQAMFPAHFIEDYMALKSDTDKLIAVANNLSPKFGEGSPEGLVEANLSHLYFDTLNNVLYINSEFNAKTGWVIT